MSASKKEPLPLTGDEVQAEIAAATPSSGQANAKLAVEHLIEHHGFTRVDARKRKTLAVAFAGVGKVVYGKAFDIMKVDADAEIDWKDLESVTAHLDRLTLYEIKSTSQEKIGPDFGSYFFSLSTAELLVAQSLGDRFKFVFVNTKRPHDQPRERTLQEVFGQAQSIYPTWSIRFAPGQPGP